MGQVAWANIQQIKNMGEETVKVSKLIDILKSIGGGIKKGLSVLVANTAGIIVVVALLASAVLLGTIAWPMATEYIQGERRDDARQTLVMLAEGLHRCHEETGSYQDSSCPQFPQDSAEGYYQISANVLQDDYFSLNARPPEESPQRSDYRCRDIRLDSEGMRTSENDIGRMSLGCW